MQLYQEGSEVRCEAKICSSCVSDTSVCPFIVSRTHLLEQYLWQAEQDTCTQLRALSVPASMLLKTWLPLTQLHPATELIRLLGYPEAVRRISAGLRSCTKSQRGKLKKRNVLDARVSAPTDALISPHSVSSSLHVQHQR